MSPKNLSQITSRPPAREGDPARPTTPRVDLPGQGKGPFLASGTPPGAAPDPNALPFIDEGRYIVEGEHARGGLGRILKARDPRLARTVAIKEPLRTSKEAGIRFMREALVTARLQHPSIVPIHEAGRWPTGELFYAMKLISGRSLDQVIAETLSLEERLALLPHILAVADAMAYAHSQRIIHRDLKPANVLIGPFGETVVIDWGLAKDLNETEPEPESEPEPEKKKTAAAPGEPGRITRPEQTVADVILGTPEYMPPEQTETSAVDERADVYALGAMLYHLLAGEPPYCGKNPAEVLTQVRRGPPPPLAVQEAGAPRDLVTIVDKTMARRPEERYPSARELAEDLRRFQTGQMVSARHYSRITLLGRWLRRHRVPVAFLLLLAVLGALSVRRIVHERALAEERSNELILVQARNSLERDPTATLAWLKLHTLPAADVAVVRDLALDAWSRGVARHVFDQQAEVKESYGDFSPDGRRVSYADAWRFIRVQDLTSGAIVARLPLEGRPFLTKFAPDGRTLATADWDSSKLWLWDLGTGAPRALSNPDGTILGFLFSPDGRRLLVGGAGRQVRLWDLSKPPSSEPPSSEDGGLLLKDHEGTGSDLAFSPDGRFVAYSGLGGTIHLVQVGTRPPEERLLAAGAASWQLHFSPDGRGLVSAGRDGLVGLWDVATGEGRMLHGHQGDVSDAKFSPSGRQVVSAGLDRTVRLWDVTTGQGRILGEHQNGVLAVAFSPDGQKVLSAGRDQTVQLWGVNTGVQRPLQGHDTAVLYVKFAADGRHFLSVSTGQTRVWTLPRHLVRVLRSEDFMSELAYSPDGGHLAIADRTGLVWLWNARTGEAHAWRGHDMGVSTVAFSPDGRRVASAGLDRTVRLWDVATGTSQILHGHQDAVRTVIFSPEGRWLASTGVDGLVYLWDVATGQGRALLGHQGDIQALAFSPDGQQLALAGADRKVWLWNVTTGKSRVLHGHTARIQGIVYSPDGRLLATAGEDGTARLWTVATGQEQWTIREPGRFQAVAFSPDGRRLAAAENGRIHLCNLSQNGAGQCQTLVGHRQAIIRITFSPDGRYLASGSRDGTVRLWDMATGTCSAIHHHEGLVSDIAFAPDGRQLASASSDRTARLWAVEPELAPPLDPQGLRAWMDAATSAVIPSGSTRPGSP